MIDQPVTLITGTRKGIGKHLALHYHSRGHRIVGVSRREPDWTLDGCDHFAADVADESAAERVFLHIRKSYGRLDNVINNAGTASMNLALLTPLTKVREIFETNVMGTFLYCREAARLMQRRKYGRIVNFSTVAVPLALKGESVYAGSKAAVVMLTEILAREFAQWNITVNCIGPGPVDTDLIRGVPPDKIREIVEQQAIKRFGTFADVTNVTDFFLSEASSLITAQTIYLGGL